MTPEQEARHRAEVEGRFPDPPGCSRCNGTLRVIEDDGYEYACPCQVKTSVPEEEPSTLRCVCGRFMKPEERFSSDSPDSFYTVWTCRACPSREGGDYGGFPEYG